MLEHLFGNRGKDLENLFAASFELIKNESMRKAYFHRLIFSGILHGLFLVSGLMFFYDWNRGLSVLLFVFSLFVLRPFSFFYHIRKRATISWYAYSGITGKNSNDELVRQKISEISWSLRILACAEIFIASAKSTKSSEDRTFWDSIKEMLISILAAVFDVAENYLLPTMVIEQVSLKAAVPKLVDMKKNVPATLAGVFGVDLIAETVSAFGFIVYFLILCGGAFFALLLGAFVPPEMKTEIGKFHVFLLPFIASGFVCSYA